MQKNGTPLISVINAEESSTVPLFIDPCKVLDIIFFLQNWKSLVWGRWTTVQLVHSYVRSYAAVK